MPGAVIKVLIVDDIPETREMLRKILAFENDIEVVAAAETGREGLEYSKEYRPDIVLMDINMPDMDGITATEEIKKILPRVGIIMMSVQSEADYLRRAMIAGARDFLTKPISGENLYETIRRVYELTPPDTGYAPGTGVPGSGGDNLRKSGGHLIAVYSPQGGAGVTTLATNTAIALMKEGTKVLLVDADLQFGDVGVFLNLQSQNTIAELVQSFSADFDAEFAQSVMVTHGSGLKVLLAPHNPTEADRVVPSDVITVLRQLTNLYDYVIVDLSTRLDELTVSILDASERVILVATATLPSIKNTRLVLDLFLNQLEYPDEKIMFVINRVNVEAKGRASIPIDAMENHLRRKTNARIPLNETVFLSAVNQGVSVIATDPHKSPASDLIGLAENLRRSIEGFEEQDAQGPVPQKRKSALGGLFGGR
jgi:pilus assembly protein CpaE